MTEKFFQYIWQHRLFYPNGIIAQPTGETIEVVNPGQLNTDAGPDFFNAQIKIGNTLWAGNVEIHLKASDWYAHKHHQDAAYDNVILHVVAAPNDKPTLTSKGRVVPEVILRFSDEIKQRFDAISSNHSTIRCGNLIGQLSSLDRNSWIDRMLAERFEQRQQMVESYIAETNCDWDQIFFILLCRAMGFVVNAEPMQYLARHTPVKILLKHSNMMQMEAVLFGQAGLLPNEPTDEYTAILKREYTLLQTKFGLEPMSGSEWKWLRLRPSNFPTIRLSQIAAIISRVPGNFESAFATTDVHSIVEQLSVAASDYWDTHYQFGKERSSSAKTLGLQSRRLIVINAVVPLLFAYARRRGNTTEQLNIVSMLSFLPVEKNSRLREWQQCGISAQHEGEAQALLLLYKEYCQKHKCLVCRWGHCVLAGHTTIHTS